MHKIPELSGRLGRLLASNTFFWIIVGWLVFQALWIALSGRYPMAFDEDFHLGLIHIYSQHLNPFLSAQPAHANVYGAVARDPSYLYHYLMSFPYRLLQLFTANQTLQVIVLRIINIGLFASCLPLYRRLLQKTGISNALIHSCLALFILLPIVPLLAAQINYDNLLLPLTATSLLLAVRFSEELQRYRRPNIQVLLQLLIVCLLASLVKFAFLPIFLVIAVLLCNRLYRSLGWRRKLWLSLGFGLTLIGRRMRLVLIAGLLLSLVLFGQRYGINLVRYHTPVPDCGQALSVQQCREYGAWVRDYTYASVKANAPRSPLTFSADWLYGMWLRLFFAVDGPATQFQTRGPLFLPAVGAIAFSTAGVVLLIRYGRRIWHDYNHSVLWLLGSTLVAYVGVLWIDEYRAFLRTGQPVAINGRYLLPVLPFFMLALALAFAELVRRRPRLRIVLAGLILFCFFWGGGALTYILRSNDAWYWPNQGVKDANHAVQRGVGPAVPGNYDPTAFLK